MRNSAIPYPVVRIGSGKALHMVNAAGGAADGGLFHFYTLCYRWIDGDYEEVEGPMPTCKVCMGALKLGEREKWAKLIAEMAVNR